MLWKHDKTTHVQNPKNENPGGVANHPIHPPGSAPVKSLILKISSQMHPKFRSQTETLNSPKSFIPMWEKPMQLSRLSCICVGYWARMRVGPLKVPLFSVLAERPKSLCALFSRGVCYMPNFCQFWVTFDGPNIAIYLGWGFEFRKCSTLNCCESPSFFWWHRKPRAF